jgi:transcriptional regulator with GAF, ATPase, and Fis domain
MPFLRCEHTLKKTQRLFPLKKPITTIGRASGNDLVLDDPVIAASHASLMRKGKEFVLAATDAKSDVFVNGQRTKSAVLAEGSVVLIGAWQLVFSEGEAPEEKPVDKGPSAGLDVLERLVSLSDELMRDTAPNRLFANLLKGLVELTRAEKGFVIVMKDGQRQLAASHNVDNPDYSSSTREKLDLSHVSDSIIQQVVDHLQPVIVSDAMSDARFGRAKSVVDLKLQSVMCVPLIYRNDLIGVIYLGNDAITGLFTDRDLQLLRVYASQASLVIHHALLLNQLRLDNTNLRDRLQQASQGQIIGTCAPMKAVFKIVRRVAPTDVSVLILGETGTGKELVAREIHNLSPRRNKAFIAINCGAIPENLLESELFGYRRGAFTGAVTDKVGKIEAASGGTLFLDEIGEMPMNLQVKLLRVLQERVIERVGDVGTRPVDLRVVAATNKNPQEQIASGAFREDLYYRLNEIALNLPALREREEDVEVLAQYFLNKYRDQYDAKPRGFTNQAVLAMKQYYWPGNVREMENRIKKAVIMSDRALLNPDDLAIVTDDKRHIRPLNDAAEEWKLDYVKRVLALNNWNKAQTARDLGVDARTIFRYIERLGEQG